MNEYPKTSSPHAEEAGHRTSEIVAGIDAIDEPTALLAEDGTIQAVNAAFVRTYNIGSDVACGRCLFSLSSIVRAGLPEGSAGETHLRLTIQPAGDPRNVLVSFSSESYVRRMVREADALIAVAQNSPDLIAISDLEGNALFLNEAGRALVGLDSDDEVRRHGMAEYFAPEDRQWARDVVDRVIREGAWTGETVMRHFKTGERIVIYNNLFSLRDPRTGEPFALASVARDIREQKRREAEEKAASDRQSRIAQTLQHALLMVPAADTFLGLTFTPLYRPALDESLVGGDFYDAFTVREGVIALIVGDATGKGLNAATYTAEIRFALRAFLREHGSPAAALTLLNDFVAENDRLDREHLGGSYVAASVAMVDTVKRTLTCATAGMESALLLRAGSGAVEEIDAPGPILGVLAGGDYRERTIALDTGDLLVIATDGITEARLPGVGAARSFFGQQGLIRSVEKAAGSAGTLREIGEVVLSDTLNWAGGYQHDDICLLLARVT